MLAEKFILVLETLRSHASDGSVKVTSAARHTSASVRHPKIDMDSTGAARSKSAAKHCPGRFSPVAGRMFSEPADNVLREARFLR